MGGLLGGARSDDASGSAVVLPVSTGLSIHIDIHSLGLEANGRVEVGPLLDQAMASAGLSGGVLA